MVELIITACLLAQPQTCDTFTPSFMPMPSGVMQCLFESQFHVIRWLEANPDWKVVRWTCDLPQA